MPWDESGDEGQDYGNDNELQPGRYLVKVDDVEFFESKDGRDWGKVSMYDPVSGCTATLMILCKGSAVSSEGKGIWRRNFYRVMKCIPYPSQEYWQKEREDRPTQTWDRSDLNRASGKELLVEIGTYTDSNGKDRTSIERMVPVWEMTEEEAKAWCGEAPATPLGSTADPDVPF